MSVSRALRACHQELLVHTGQHYDYLMSQAFFDELEIPAPDFNLGGGSGSQAKQTAEMMVRMEELFLAEKPDLVIVRGDTNSTIAAGITSAKLHIPTAHIEAGERSYNREMPEEINRVVVDCIADLHFCVSEAAVKRLAEEGIKRSVHWVGDVMYDAMLLIQPIARRNAKVMSTLEIQPGRYSLVTIHRAANTDDPERLRAIVSALNGLNETVIFPVHPRTRKAIETAGVEFAPNVRAIEPVGYYDMLVLEENARLIATDSGGVQREAYFLSKPCLTLRDETEWTATVTTGWNQLVGANPEKIRAGWFSFTPPAEHPPIFGDGTAGKRIAQVISDLPANFSVPHSKIL